MPCLVAFLALLAPRVTSVVLWVFTDFFSRAFHDKVLLLILGIVLMPFTTLAYAWAINAHGAVDGIFVVVMILAVIADLSALSTSRRRRFG
jgi:hypothetical protein